MKRFRGLIAAAMVISFFLYPARAKAQQCEKVLTLKVSDPAPCSGLLWPEGYTKTALSCLKVDVPRLEAVIDRLKLEHAAELRAVDAKLMATEDSLIQSENRLREAMAIDPAPWYMSPYLWTAVGVVLGVGLTVGAVKLAGELR